MGSGALTAAAIESSTRPSASLGMTQECVDQFRHLIELRMTQTFKHSTLFLEGKGVNAPPIDEILVLESGLRQIGKGRFRFDSRKTGSRFEHFYDDSGVLVMIGLDQQPPARHQGSVHRVHVLGLVSLFPFRDTRFNG